MWNEMKYKKLNAARAAVSGAARATRSAAARARSAARSAGAKVYKRLSKK